MEQPIWMFFGVFAIIISLGLTAKVVKMHKQEIREDHITDTMDKLEVQCDFVCDTTKGNLLSIDVKIPSGAKLYSKEDRICSIFDNEKKCIRCACEVDDFTLDLSNISIAKKFNEHTYSCFFERMEESVRMECLG